MMAALCAAAVPAMAHPGHEHSGIFGGHDAVLAWAVVVVMGLVAVFYSRK